MVEETKKMEIDGTYEGKVDENKKACGEGLISFPSMDTWQATWRDDKRHGYCKYPVAAYGEFKALRCTEWWETVDRESSDTESHTVR